MPDTGSPWFLPYPALSDEADAPKYIEALAEQAAAGLTSGQLSDSGWVAMTVGAGFAAQVGWTPQVRKIGNVVYMRGGVMNTGFTANGTMGSVLIVPAQFRAAYGVAGRCGTSTGAAAASFLMGATGNIDFRTNGTLSTYYILPPITYFLD